MEQTKRNWTEKSANSENQWKPQMTEKNGFRMSDKKSDNFLQGYYLGSKEIKGQDGKPFLIHTIHELDESGSLGRKSDVVGNKVLNDLLDKVKVGNYIGIQYMGRHHKKGYEGNWTQTNSYHIWKVFEDEGAVKYNQLGGSDNTEKKETPAATTNTASNGNTAATSSAPFPDDDNDDLPF